MRLVVVISKKTGMERCSKEVLGLTKDETSPVSRRSRVLSSAIYSIEFRELDFRSVKPT